MRFGNNTASSIEQLEEDKEPRQTFPTILKIKTKILKNKDSMTLIQKDTIIFE